MKISYSILTHNETASLLKLLEFLVKHKDEEDEIVILDDYSDNKETQEILDTMGSIYNILTTTHTFQVIFLSSVIFMKMSLFKFYFMY